MKNNRKIWIALGVVLVLGALGAAVVFFISRKEVVVPDPAKNRNDAIAFVASKEFARMPLAKQREYAAKLRPPRGQRPPDMTNGQRPPRPDEHLTEAQRQAFRKNMRRVREAEMNERLDSFFAKSKEEQLAELDQRIAEHQSRRRQNRRHPPEPPQQAAEQTTKSAAQQTGTAANTAQNANTQQRRRRFTAQERRNADEEWSPATRAKMHAYFQMMRLHAQGKLK